MKAIIYKASILISWLLLLQSNVYAQHSRIRKEVKSLMKEYNAIGLSVAVVKADKLVYTHAFGMKNIEDRQKLKPRDIFRIASISKSFSATAIMQLTEAGILSLDDDVGQLIGFSVRNPKYPDKMITLRMILSHTSSINDSQGYFNLDIINPNTNPNYTACYSDYPPGGGYRYCNLNFNMAGTVIEKTSGERFDQYIVNHILKPLHLYGGYCVDSLDNSLFATLYEYDSATQKFTAATAAYHPRREEIKNYKPGYSTPIFSPTGGMKISAPDLARYMQMHINMGTYHNIRILSEASEQQMRTTVNPEAKYGLALRTTTTFIPGKELVGHTGSAYGLNSAMFFSPTEKFGLVLITNGCHHPGGGEEFLKAVAQVLYKYCIE